MRWGAWTKGDACDILGPYTTDAAEGVVQVSPYELAKHQKGKVISPGGRGKNRVIKSSVAKAARVEVPSGKLLMTDESTGLLLVRLSKHPGRSVVWMDPRTGRITPRGEAGDDARLERISIQVLSKAAKDVAREFDEQAGDLSQDAKRALVESMLSKSKARVSAGSLEQGARQAARREALLATPSHTLDSLTALRGAASQAAVRTAVSRAVAKGRMFTVKHEGRTIVPTFQLDNEGNPRRELASLIRPLVKSGLGPWQLWTWLTAPHPVLAGRSPADAVADATTERDAISLAEDFAAQLRPAAK